MSVGRRNHKCKIYLQDPNDVRPLTRTQKINKQTHAPTGTQKGMATSKRNPDLRYVPVNVHLPSPVDRSVLSVVATEHRRHSLPKKKKVCNGVPPPWLNIFMTYDWLLSRLQWQHINVLHISWPRIFVDTTRLRSNWTHVRKGPPDLCVLDSDTIATKC